MDKTLRNYGYIDSNKQKIEDWFDKHPIPWDIEIYTILTTSFYEVVIYCAKDFKDDYLVKIICNNARRAVTLSAEIKSLCETLGLDRVIIHKKLFLLRRSFFEA